MIAENQANIVERVICAVSTKKPLNISGGNSKSFYGREVIGDVLNLGQHTGIINYEPSELVLTAKSGTKIKEIQKLLAQNHQMLGFEPPFCTSDSTFGGVIAAGLAGSGQPYTGSVRDFILGVKLINGHAQVLSFGGQVMKNVAGFDLSRLMVGSLGTLGVLLEISIRVVPMPLCTKTIKLEHVNADNALTYINQISSTPLPISASSWQNGVTRIRLTGTNESVDHALTKTAGNADIENESYWHDLSNHSLSQFKQAGVVLKASLPASSSIFGSTENQIIDWGGSQRWYFDPKNLLNTLDQIHQHGGKFTVFKSPNRQNDVFSPLDKTVMQLHKNIKQSFDPFQIFNVGRMYKDF